MQVAEGGRDGCRRWRAWKAMRDGLEPSPNHAKFTNALMLGYTPPAPDVLMIREYVGEEGEAGEMCDGEEEVGED